MKAGFGIKDSKFKSLVISICNLNLFHKVLKKALY